MARLVVQALIRKAVKGDVRAAREILDRIEGTVAQTLTLGPAGEQESQTDLIITILPETTPDSPRLLDHGVDPDE
jgi:hypothetical protein